MLSIFKKKADKAPTETVPSVNLFDVLALSNQATDKKLQEIILKLDECSSNELNYVACALLKALEYDSQIIDGVHDKGIDVIGFKDNHREVAVQCKAWNPKKATERINVKDVQAFKGCVLSSNYQYGLFITTHYFSDPALKEEDDRLMLIDRKALYSLLNRYFPSIMADCYYRETLKTLSTCPKCNSGNLLKLYAKSKRVYYHWCENCDERIFNFKNKAAE
ncbi:restriction endonuclease [Wohlfahrtiimonas chitiniclastica]|uniref:Restriction endonuclease n=1 Tax=Wohlfahrtiimonas chitiniclastica TaxID=400946 RepID=A0A162U5H1_9GAMM|nr:restriction endonuclease [Wohlfahrtiimonas chitiniclastica]KZS22721.1 hypothetical protein BMY_0548 [Wohlfahrtiimonas chitiniclastica]KZX38199.1 hypothetical protein A6V30_04785 [Wohlfahrtiimonas chitiniclastica]MBS7814998.1 restriction endonuclease [Wohlfahrtiimonas chitiniclastica]MBS7815978.1 restriction endonuclease [Wohlfahrtiimonas chitiniclastica]MBS7818770.1 restriction endonuclease [Wohlfahrtiimonas chitiniclastica]